MNTKMKNVSLWLVALACIAGCRQAKEPVDYVNNSIGNISILLVPAFPTTHLPNSMLRMLPTRNEYVTDRMRGFPLNTPSHRHEDVLLLMPFSGNAEPDPNVNYR